MSISCREGDGTPGGWYHAVSRRLADRPRAAAAFYRRLRSDERKRRRVFERDVTLEASRLPVER